MKIKKGDFDILGPKMDQEGVTFTGCVSPSSKERYINIYNRENKKLIKEIKLTEDYFVGNVFSVRVYDIIPSQICYLIKEDGTLRLDPYCTRLFGREKWADSLGREKNKFSTYCGVSDLSSDWADEKVHIDPKNMVMYKLHMRGFTAGFSMSETKTGTYKGLLSKLNYLKELGVTSIELMPCYDFEELFLETKQSITPKGQRVEKVEFSNKINYWGYGSASYFSPKASYFGPENPSAGLRDFVGKLHKNGMELIMEMSFDNTVSDDMIMDCLRFYVMNYHVDGFHILGCNAPIKRIADCPLLGDTKIFYEYILDDILYSESGKKHLFLYNDSFMNVTRQIQNHMNGSMVQFANHMRRQNNAFGFVNYMSNVCGFSLWDSYSYGEKHNQANGEDNRDGNNNNFSFNYGVEGKTNNKTINANRFREMRNAFAALFLSQSIPLIVAGDEMAATHEGNNNPYCQDNKIGYTSFSKTKNKTILLNFVKMLINFRKQHQCIRPENSFSMNDYQHLGLPDMSFHGSEPWTMSIGEEQKALGVLFNGAYAKEDEDVYVCYNFHYDEVEMALPLLAPGKRWRIIFNTANFDEKSTFSPKAINNQQSIKVPGSSISLLVGMKP